MSRIPPCKPRVQWAGRLGWSVVDDMVVAVTIEPDAAGALWVVTARLLVPFPTLPDVKPSGALLRSGAGSEGAARDEAERLVNEMRDAPNSVPQKKVAS